MRSATLSLTLALFAGTVPAASAEPLPQLKGFSAQSWQQIQNLTALDAATSDDFGFSVSISGDTIVVGARLDDDAGTSSGSAYVFERDQGWDEVKKLTASDAALADTFGGSVSISGDTIVIGAYQDDDAGNASGSAYVFERDLGGADNWGEALKLTASDAAATDLFGWAVSISEDTIVVGAFGNSDAGTSSGSAYVFERNQGGADNWGELTKLTASDAEADDEFGIAVSINGSTLVVGAYQDDDAGTSSGSAYVFERNQGGADNWGELTKLTASDAEADDEFGIAVSINGSTLVVGAYQDDDAGNASGSAYVFERDLGGGDNWGESLKLTASDGEADDNFAGSVSISGDTVVIGARFDDDAGSASGSAYVFERDQGWDEVQKLTASDAEAEDEFGFSVSISLATLVIGARRGNDDTSNSGSAYVFQEAPPFALSFPLAEGNPFTRPMSAFMDHTPPFNGHDGIVVGFDESEGRVEFGCKYFIGGGVFGDCDETDYTDHDVTGFRQEDGSPFLTIVNYDGGFGGEYGFYDGHTGHDYPGANGETEILAAADGVVSSVTDTGGPVDHEIVVDHEGCWKTFYLHHTDTTVSMDDTVARGQLLGTVGLNHLHFTVKCDDVRIDPYGWTGVGEDPLGYESPYLWEVPFGLLLADGFESGDTSAWN